MDVNQFDVVLLDIIVVMVAAPLARRVGAPLPVALVAIGAALGLTPWVPRLEVPPDLAFLVFVPPLLYWSCVTSSRRDLRRERGSIAMLAVGAVAATIAAVGVCAHWLPPRLPWAPAFVLGAIVAPPDAAVTIALARKLGIPHRLAAVLEGETLFNDVAAFTGYKLAVAATLTGAFTPGDAALHVLRHAAGGVAVGWAVARGVILLRRRIHEPVVANTLSLLTAFAAYLPAEWLDCSGVLAVVTTGLLLARVAPRLVDAETRVQANSTWAVVMFVLEGLIFLLIGQRLGALASDMARDREAALTGAIAVVTAVVIVTRLAWVLGASWVARRFGPRHRAVPPWRTTLFLGWTGIRGGDTLVTALAVPLALPDGAPFPGRHAIVVVAFGVILATLLLQGLTLKPVLGACTARADEGEAGEERQAREALAQAGAGALDRIAERDGLPPEIVAQIRVHHHLRRHVRSGSEWQPENVGASILGASLLRINREVLAAEREAVIALRERDAIGDGVLRRIQRELDLEELVMRRLVDD